MKLPEKKLNNLKELAAEYKTYSINKQEYEFAAMFRDKERELIRYHENLNKVFIFDKDQMEYLDKMENVLTNSKLKLDEKLNERNQGSVL